MDLPLELFALIQDKAIDGPSEERKEIRPGNIKRAELRTLTARSSDFISDTNLNGKAPNPI
jgi:hypothetical protein